MQNCIEINKSLKIYRMFFTQQINIGKNSVKRIPAYCIYPIALPFSIAVQTDK